MGTWGLISTHIREKGERINPEEKSTIEESQHKEMNDVNIIERESNNELSHTSYNCETGLGFSLSEEKLVPKTPIGPQDTPP